MSRKVNVSGTWKPVTKQFVNVNGTWKLVQRQYVNVNGTWKFAGARTPTAPTNVSLTVNGSSTSSQNISSSPVNCQVTWSLGTSDSGLPVEVQFYKGASQVGSTQNITSGSSATQSVTFNSGESANVLAYVRTRNGPSGITVNDVYSNQVGSNAITVTYPSPSLGTVNVLRSSGSSDVNINWSANNLPGSGVTYTVDWSDTTNTPTSTPLASIYINATTRTATIPFSVHGNQLYDTNVAGTTVTFYVAVTLFVNGVQQGNPSYGDAAFFNDANA